MVFLPLAAAIITRFQLTLFNCSKNTASKINADLILLPPSHVHMLTLICGTCPTSTLSMGHFSMGKLSHEGSSCCCRNSRAVAWMLPDKPSTAASRLTLCAQLLCHTTPSKAGRKGGKLGLPKPLSFPPASKWVLSLKRAKNRKKRNYPTCSSVI